MACTDYEYKGFSLIPLFDKVLLGDGNAKSIPSPYVQATCMVHRAGEVLVAYERNQPNYSLLECPQMPLYN